jgi:hypothetical protein
LIRFLKDSEEGTYVEVLVTPNAKTTVIEGVNEGGLVVKVAAPPRGGRANKELLRFFKKLFKARVILVSGHHSRRKKVLIRGLSTEEVERIINKASTK